MKFNVALTGVLLFNLNCTLQCADDAFSHFDIVRDYEANVPQEFFAH